MTRTRSFVRKLYSASPVLFRYGEVVLIGLAIVFSLIGIAIVAITCALSAIALGCVGIYFGRKPKHVYLLPKERFNSTICQSVNNLIHAFCTSKELPLPSGGTRITLFTVERPRGRIESIGRFSWGAEIFSVPDISFSIGEGMIGRAVERGEDVVVENLPSVDVEPELYYEALMKYNLSKDKILSLNTRSRAFYNFPIRTYRKGLEAVRFALCIDTDQPSLTDSEYGGELFRLIKAQLRIVGDLASIEE